MLYEVKYGLDITLNRVRVQPLFSSAEPPSWDFVLGETHIGFYGGTAFHGELGGLHAGARNFVVSHMLPGSYTVTATGVAPFAVPVAADGTLSFTARVGRGFAVDAVRG